MRILNECWTYAAVVVVAAILLLVVCSPAPAQCPNGQCPANSVAFTGNGPVRNLMHAAVDAFGHGPIGEAIHQRPHVIQHLLQNRPHLFGHRRRGCG